MSNLEEFRKPEILIQKYLSIVAIISLIRHLLVGDSGKIHEFAIMEGYFILAVHFEELEAPNH